MGKASSAKKIARASRSGDRTRAQQAQLGYPILLAVLIVLGFGLVTYARQSGGSAGARTPKIGDQNAAYGIYVCDHFIVDGFGVVGAKEKFPVLFADSDTSVTGSTIKLPKAAPYDGRQYKAGTTTCKGKPATIEVVHWTNAVKAAAGAKPDKTYTTGITDIKAIGDLSALTIAFVPAGTKTILPPPNASTFTSDAVATAAEPTATTTTTTLVLNGNTVATTAATSPATVPVTGATTAPASGGTTTP